MSIIVMVDGSANITKSMIKKYNLDVLPYNVVFFNGDTYRDIVDIKNQSELVQLIQEHGDFPKLLHLEKDKVRSKFKRHIENGNDILYITSSAKLTAAYEIGIEISKEFSIGTIEVIDSLSVGSGITLLALEAIKYIEKGYGLKQTAKYINKLKHSIRSSYAVGNFNYLYNQHHCDVVEYNYLEFYETFPVVEIHNGNIVLTYNAKEKDIALQILKNTISDYSRYINDSLVVISYSGDKKVANKLKEYIGKSFTKNIIVLENGSAIFLNTGLDTVGVTFLGRKHLI